MSAAGEHDLPDDVEALKALLLAEREAHRVALREQALNIEQLKQTIAKLRHDRFGPSSERRALLGQLELSLFELEEDQAEAETRHEINAPRGIKVQPFDRRSNAAWKPAVRPPCSNRGGRKATSGWPRAWGSSPSRSACGRG